MLLNLIYHDGFIRVCCFADLLITMEFRSQRGRGNADSHGYSSSSRRREEKPVRSKRRDDDRSSYRHSHTDTHKTSSVDSMSKESTADSRRSASEITSLI